MDLCNLGRAYGNLAMGLAAFHHPSADDGSWVNGLLASVQQMDDELDRVLIRCFEQTLPRDDDGILAAVRLALTDFESAGPMPMPMSYARHAGVVPNLPTAWGEWGIAAQAEIAASLAWAEFTRRHGKHRVQAATAARERHNLLRQCLLADVGQRLQATEGQERVLLLTLAWIGLHDLAHAVKR